MVNCNNEILKLKWTAKIIPHFMLMILTMCVNLSKHMNWHRKSEKTSFGPIIRKIELWIKKFVLSSIKKKNAEREHTYFIERREKKNK